MANLILEKINKKYPNGFHAVKDVDFEIYDKEFMVLVGPSGCGKTTTLRMIAGLEEITSGNLKIGDRQVNNVSPKDRNIAMVFQNYALYPHMTVYDNMAFGLKLKKVSKKEIDEKIQKAAKILDIESLLTRKPKELSGGQRQRVALGRAIVREPEVFLMDEPLSNLDAKLRVQMRAELIKLHNDLATTFVYVTHDQTEAMTMGSRICVMNLGEVQQIADPKTIYNKPANIFVAGFIGAPPMNFFDGKVKENGMVEVMGRDYLIHQDIFDKIKALDKVGASIQVGARPEDIEIVKENGTLVTVTLSEMLGSDQNVYFTQEGKQYILRTDSEHIYSMGDEIMVELQREKLHMFDSDTGKSYYYM